MGNNLSTANIKGKTKVSSGSRLFEPKKVEPKKKEKKVHKLQDAVASKYDCTIVPTVLNLQDGRRVDLRKINVKQADALVAEGLEVLVLRQASSSGKGDKNKS